MKIINKLNRKAQEEMFGFVVLVVLIIIIGVIFFIFSLKQTPAATINSKIQKADDLNIALLAYTTDCRDNSNQLLEVRRLIRECYIRPYGTCYGKTITFCNALNQTIMNIANKTELTLKANGFKVNISSDETGLFSYIYTKGNLTGNSFSSTDYSIVVPGSFLNFRITYFETRK